MISVIIPVYNCEAYLPMCIESVLNQTYRDLEIVLVNDGSTDGSGAICDRYAEQDSRIRVIHQTNQGVSVARNVALAQASGEWITFADSDDAVEPSMYETLLRLAEEYQADITHCGYRKVYFDGTHKDILGTEQRIVQDKWEAGCCLLEGKHFTGSLWTKLYRRDLFEGVRFDPSLRINEDVLVNVKVFQNADKLVFWDVPLYNYYERKQSATRKNSPLKMKQDVLAAALAILDIYRGTPLESVAAAKARYTLFDLYREYVLGDVRGTKEELREIDRQYRAVNKLCERGAWGFKANHALMRYGTGLYRLVYRMYQKIHTPDYDI